MPESNEDFRYMLGRLDGKMDSLLSLVRQTQDIQQEHEKRIRTLETSKAWVLGWSSAAAILVSVVIQYLFKGK